jgi:hypothetical protein
VGIVLGVVIGLVGMVLAVVLLFKWWKKRNQNTTPCYNWCHG